MPYCQKQFVQHIMLILSAGCLLQLLHFAFVCFTSAALTSFFLTLLRDVLFQIMSFSMLFEPILSWPSLSNNRLSDFPLVCVYFSTQYVCLQNVACMRWCFVNNYNKRVSTFYQLTTDSMSLSVIGFLNIILQNGRMKNAGEILQN